MLAVISGGSQGLGFALAEIYARKGYEVVLVARTESKLAAAVAKIGTNARYIAADVSSPKSCDEVFAKLGKVPDLVLCCAGAAQPGLFVETSSSDLTKNFTSVYLTALYFSHAALRVMSQASDKLTHKRHIVYCSSTVAIFPFYGYSAYAPAKAAIRGLSDVIRQECIEHNIRVSLLLPGTMDTEGYAVEELSKPAITKKIEGASTPLAAPVVAEQIIRDLEKGEDTIYTDTISWVLGSMMMGITPRVGYGIFQTVVGLFLVLFGPIVRWFVDGDVKDGLKQAKENNPTSESCNSKNKLN